MKMMTTIREVTTMMRSKFSFRKSTTWLKRKSLMRMKVAVMLGGGEGDGGTWVVRAMGKMSSGSSPLPSIDALKWAGLAKQLLPQRAVRSRQTKRRESDILPLKTWKKMDTDVAVTSHSQQKQKKKKKKKISILFHEGGYSSFWIHIWRIITLYGNFILRCLCYTYYTNLLLE